MIAWLRKLLEATEPAVAYGAPDRVETVQAALKDFAPLAALDGGSIELVGIEDDGWVVVAMRGACASCSASPQTLSQALEPRLRAAAPWFVGLRSV